MLLFYIYSKSSPVKDLRITSLQPNNNTYNMNITGSEYHGGLTAVYCTVLVCVCVLPLTLSVKRPGRKKPGPRLPCQEKWESFVVLVNL